MAKKGSKNRGGKPDGKEMVKRFWIIFLSPFALLLLLLLLTAMGLFGKLPSFEDLENPKSNLATEIYSENGDLLGTYFLQNRSYVSYEELSPNLVDALVSTEDIRFYSHSGIDFPSLFRVAIKTVALGQKQGGGSTITQQVAKNLYRTRDRLERNQGITRKPLLVITKFKEWITAVMLEHNYTKEEIISMYFNTVEYGSNAFGIKSAAHTFFNKLPSELTVEEAAMLVGVVNAPTRYSPVSNYDNAIKRRNLVISRMEDYGRISKKVRDSVSQLPITLDYRPVSHDTGSGTYFREMLRLYMTASEPQRDRFESEWEYDIAARAWENDPLYGWCHKNFKSDGTEYNLYRDGIKIYTTINSHMQEYAEKSMVDQLSNVVQPRLDAQIKSSKQLFIRASKAQIENIMDRSIRGTDRYRTLDAAGMSKEEILKTFDEPVAMKIFSYKGDIDTVMTPRDSILYHKQIMRSGFMAMDPATGHVRAYVGGPDFRYFKYDMVRQGKRQVGSTIKPFVYTFAIDHMGLNPCTPVPNLKVSIETYNSEPWSPDEAGSVVYDGVKHPLSWGLARSRNNYSAWIMKEAKQPAAVADFIYKLGIKSYIDPVYALCLGTPDMSLYEMVATYCIYANKGVYTEPVFVTRIEDRQGNIISSFSPHTSDAISEQTAYTMLQMLRGVVTSGTANRIRTYGLTGEVGGKTGTTDNNSDAWFIGITPNLVGGVWVGGEERSTHLYSRGEGAVSSLPIFGEFMSQVYADKTLGISKDDTFEIPQGVVMYNCTDADMEESTVTADSSDRDEFFD